jgi:hypothetical protein
MAAPPSQTKCAWCLKDHPSFTMMGTKDGPICICCGALAYYDGWERREKDLDPEEFRKLYPERVAI